MTVTISGNAGIARPLGSAGSPSDVNTSDSTTGLYFPASNTVGISTGGTNALYIDASQNVGIGTSSPTAKLNVSNTSSFVNVDITSGSGFNAGLNIKAASTFLAGFGTAGNYLGGASATDGIVYTNNNLIFGTNAAERMRIDTSGNLLVGTTAQINGEKLNVTGSTANQITRLYNSNSSPNGLGIFYSTATPNTVGNSFIYASDATTYRFIVQSNGGIYNYSANNSNLSDERLKKDIQLSGNYLDKLCAIPVKTFLFNDQTDQELNLGVIAQDVLAAAPELVDKDGWGEKAPDGTPYMAIYETDLKYAMLKAIQELKAEFDAYKAAHP